MSFLCVSCLFSTFTISPFPLCKKKIYIYISSSSYFMNNLVKHSSSAGAKVLVANFRQPFSNYLLQPALFRHSSSFLCHLLPSHSASCWVGAQLPLWRCIYPSTQSLCVCASSMFLYLSLSCHLKAQEVEFPLQGAFTWGRRTSMKKTNESRPVTKYIFLTGSRVATALKKSLWYS